MTRPIEYILTALAGAGLGLLAWVLCVVTP